MNIREKIFRLVEPSHDGDLPSKIFDIFIISLVIINVTILVIATLPSMFVYLPYFSTFEMASVVIFSIEYLNEITEEKINNLISSVESEFKPIII